MRTAILLIHRMDWMPKWRPDDSRSLSNIPEWCSGNDIHWKSKSATKWTSTYNKQRGCNVQKNCRVKSKGKYPMSMGSMRMTVRVFFLASDWLHGAMLCDVKDSCGCAAICKGWGSIVEWWEKGDDDENSKGVSGSTRVNESDASIVVTVTSGERWQVVTQWLDAAQTKP